MHEHALRTQENPSNFTNPFLHHHHDTKDDANKKLDALLSSRFATKHRPLTAFLQLTARDMASGYLKHPPVISLHLFTSLPPIPKQDSGQHSADNLQLPLENGTVNEKGKINISEEVNRTTIWKQVNNCNVLFTKKQTPVKHSQQQL